MKKLFPLFALLFLPIFARAETKSNIPYVTPTTPTTSTSPTSTDQTLDAILPDPTPQNPGPFPAVLMIHGGGWSGGDKAADFHQLYKPLNDAGIACFSINYRLAPKNRWPACIEDVDAALHFLHDHAKEFNVDSTRLAILGYSAGGHLAFYEATHTTIPLRAVVGLAPPTDLELDLPQRGGLSQSLQNLLDKPHELNPESQKLLRDISPLHDLRKSFPPVLIIHGTADKSVLYQDTVNFQKADEALGNTCDVIPLKDAPHRIRDWPKALPDYPEQLATWLHENLYNTAAASQPAR